MEVLSVIALVFFVVEQVNARGRSLLAWGGIFLAWPHAWPLVHRVLS